MEEKADTKALICTYLHPSVFQSEPAVYCPLCSNRKQPVKQFEPKALHRI